MKRKSLFSLPVVVLLVAVLAVPALTVSALDGQLQPREQIEQGREPLYREGEVPARDFSDLIQDYLDRILRLLPWPPVEPPQEPPGRPEGAPTIDPSGYRPGRG